MNDTLTGAGPKRHLHSLNASLDVLELLAEAREPLTLGEIAVRLSMSKAAVHGMLSNFEVRRYVQRVGPRGGYLLGHRLWELGLIAGDAIELPKIAHRHLVELTALSGESSQLAEYCSPGEVTYLDRVDSPNPVQAFIQVGRRAPAYCVATGRALLAFQPQSEIDLVCSGPLKAYTPITITDPDALRRELKIVRDCGYALNRGEYRGEIVGVAAPVRDHHGAVIAALSVSGPNYRFQIERAEALAPAIVRAANEVSRELGMLSNNENQK